MKHLNFLLIRLRTLHRERELKRALHLIDHHRDALQDALDTKNLHIHGNPKRRKVAA